MRGFVITPETFSEELLVTVARHLRCHVAQALGHLVLFALWAQAHAADGELAGFRPVDLAQGAKWFESPERFVFALEQSGVISADTGREGTQVSFPSPPAPPLSSVSPNPSNSFPPLTPPNPSFPRDNAREGVFMAIQCREVGEVYLLSDAKVTQWKQSFPGVDVEHEVRSAVQWMEDNPERRKTKRGMNAYLGNWLRRVYERGRTEPMGPKRVPNPAPQPHEYKRGGW